MPLYKKWSPKRKRMRTTIKNQKCKNIFIIFIIFSVNFIKKEALACFPVNLAKFLRTPFLQNTSDGCFFVWQSSWSIEAIFVFWFFSDLSPFLRSCFFIRGCLHVEFHPGMELVPGWNYPCLWWNVSYCSHVFVEMKFHPGMNPSLSKRQGWNFILGWKKDKEDV